MTSVEKLDESSSGVIGDSFLSGAIVAYSGAFSHSFRNELFSQWYQACLERDIPVSRNFDFTEFLTKPIEIKRWLSNSLPQDNNSIQSAVLVKNSRKWPLLIDPQRQALKWIAEMEKCNDLKIIKLADANCLPTLEEAVQLGKPVVITVIIMSIKIVMVIVWYTCMVWYTGMVYWYGMVHLYGTLVWYFLLCFSKTCFAKVFSSCSCSMLC